MVPRTARNRRIAASGIGALLLVTVVILSLWLRSDGARRSASQHRPGTAPAQTPPKAGTPLANDPPPQVLDQGETSPKVTVQGRVADNFGVPISGATVTSNVVQAADLVAASLKGTLCMASATTDAAGRFVVSVCPAEVEFRFCAFADGYVAAGETVRVPREGIEGLEFRLHKAGSISGRVVDLERQPLAHITVVTWCEGHLGAESPPTASDGAFRIADLDPGPCSLYARYAMRAGGSRSGRRAEAGGPANPLLELTLAEGEQRTGVELVVPFQRDAVVEGTVLDEAGAPVPGAEVWAGAARCVDPLLGFAVSKVDEAGRFRIEGLVRLSADSPEANLVSLHGECAGYEPVCTEKVPVGTTDAEVVLLRERRGSIVGVVLEEASRKPIPDAHVYLWHVATEWGEKWDVDHASLPWMIRKGQGKVGAGGRFEINDVRAGVAGLLAQAPGYGMTEKDDIMVRPGETTEVEILLAQPGTLQVKVVYTGQLEGRKAADLRVSCYSTGDAGTTVGLYPELQSAFRGEKPESAGPIDAATYEFTLQPGQYDVELMSMPHIEEDPFTPPSKRYRLAQATVYAGQTTLLEMGTGGSGVIQAFAPTHEGDQRVYLYLTPGSDTSALEETRNPSELVAKYGEVQFVPSGQDGRCLFYCIPEGTYTVTAIVRTQDEERYTRGSKTVEVRPDEVLNVEFP